MRIKNIKINPIVSISFLIMMTFFLRPSPVEGSSVVWTDRNVYHQDEMIQVIFSNAPGNDSDWICIVPAGSPDTDGGDYQYMPRGLDQGSLIFDPHPPGEYEVRAYYNYRRNGYVVSGRYAFSVVGDPAEEELWTQGMEPIGPYDSPEADLPPPVPFVAPPNVVVLPGFDVYVVPDVEVELFFQGGWWWRPWGGRWYRSRYHDHGWSYYRDPPSWYKKIPRDWRQGYRNRIWGGRPWNPPHINHGNLGNHWRGGRWRNDHGLGRPGTPAPPGGRPGVGRPGGGPSRPVPPGVGSATPVPRGGRPGVGRPGGGPGRPVPPGVGSGTPVPRGGGPGVGKPGGGPGRPVPPAVSPGGGKSGSSPDGGKSGGGSGKPPLRGFGYDERPESGGK